MLLKTFSKTLSFFTLFFIAVYRSVGSAWLGGACRFEPSCSEYCTQAFKNHSFITAIYLSLKRLSRCRPGGGFGYDPLPQRKCCGGHS